MKKLIALLGVSLLLAGCQSKTEPAPEPMTEPVQQVEVQHESYIVSGRYYTGGTVITEDGNAWGYTQDIISEEPSYDNEPVYAVFDDNGTPDNIYDDTIRGLVLDKYTAIYDELETALSANFTVERNGNDLHISMP